MNHFYHCDLSDNHLNAEGCKTTLNVMQRIGINAYQTYLLLALDNHSYLEVELEGGTEDEYALLLSRDVFEYVNKADFEALESQSLIQPSLEQPHPRNIRYGITNEGRRFCKADS